MKTAEEWMSQMSGLDEPTLLTVNRMAIREIQLDAYKAGMTKAAEIHSRFMQYNCDGTNEIIKIRDNTTTL